MCFEAPPALYGNGLRSLMHAPLSRPACCLALPEEGKLPLHDLAIVPCHTSGTKCTPCMRLAKSQEYLCDLLQGLATAACPCRIPMTAGYSCAGEAQRICAW